MFRIRCFSFLLLLSASGIPAQENLVRNGDFSDSSGAFWSIDPNGAQASAVVEIGRYLVTVRTSGNLESAPQVFQRNIDLMPGEAYRLSFKVSGNDSGYIRAFVASENNTFYSDSSKGRFTVSTKGETHSLDFFVQQVQGSARLVFNCGLSPNLTRISIDSVVLMKKTEPVILLTEPSVNARWVSGTERRIVWQNSGVLDQVKIGFSSDSGITWSVITGAASNQKSFWWKVPQSTAGNNCRIVVSDLSGSIADTSGPFKIVQAGTVDAMEMVKNGNFLDTTDWRLSVLSPASAEGSFKNDRYIIDITEKGEEPWQIKLEQPGFTLENGAMYRFSFDAWASHDRSIYANVGADNGNPAWSVFGGDSIPVNITTDRNRYYQTIIMKYPTSSNIRIEFNCGSDTGSVHIDSVSLIRMETADVFIFSPSLGSFLKSGSKYNIEWQAAEVSTVDLFYSLDSGSTWISILDGVDNLGVFSWNVPDKSSEYCFIQIRDGLSDSIIGQSSQFQINRFGAPVKTGELVVNGSFSNNQQGWNTAFHNAQGHTSFNDQQFGIEINEPGNSLGSIVLSQSDLPVLSGKDYTLSCAAFANGTRSMGVKIFAEDDSVALLDTLVELPSIRDTLTFMFTAENDAMARIEFHIGGSRAGVFIDDVSFYTGPNPTPATVAFSSRPHESRLSARPSGKGVLFSLSGPTDGNITIFSLHGALLRRFPVSRQILWDGTNHRGHRVGPGSYIAAFSNGTSRQALRFILR